MADRRGLREVKSVPYPRLYDAATAVKRNPLGNFFFGGIADTAQNMALGNPYRGYARDGLRPALDVIPFAAAARPARLIPKKLKRKIGQLADTGLGRAVQNTSAYRSLTQGRNTLPKRGHVGELKTDNKGNISEVEAALGLPTWEATRLFSKGMMTKYMMEKQKELNKTYEPKPPTKTGDR